MYLDKLALITQDPMWTLGHWQPIWKINTGQYDDLKK